MILTKCEKDIKMLEEEIETQSQIVKTLEIGNDLNKCEIRD